MITTLILLAVMTISAALSMRMALTSDQVGNNLRARMLAFQSAEIGLRYCEKLLIADPLGTKMLVAYRGYSPNAEWVVDALWNSHGIEVPLAEINLPNTVSKAPKCLIRHFSMEEWRKISPPVSGTVTAESRGFNAENFSFYRITVKGFSPDFSPPARAGDYQATVGSEVRLQSMVRAIN